MSRLAELEQRFDALQPRERLLVSLAIGVLLVLFVYLLWVEPAAKSAREQQAQIETLAPQVAAERAALTRVQEELARDPEAARRALLEQLRSEAAGLDAQLRADEAEVIPPARMPAVLRELLGRDSRLRVVGVDAVPPNVLRWTPAQAPATAQAATATSASPATAPTTASPDLVAAAAQAQGTAALPGAGAPAQMPDPAADVPALYRHRVVLRFEGDFAATLDYVRAVEALPLRVRLEDLEVDATHWPKLGVRLTVETLGLEEGWIGV